MVNQQIVQYIEDNLKKGYNVNQVREYLIESGWNSFQVDEAINYIYYGSQPQQTYQPQQQLNIAQLFDKRKIIISSCALVIILVFLLLSYMFFFTEKETTDISKIRELPFSYSLDLISEKIQPGDALVFINTFSGSKTSEVIYPKYKVITEEGSLVDKWESKDPVILGSNQEVIHKLAKNINSGRYIIVSESTYKGKKINATAYFRVYKESTEPTCEDGIKNQGEEKIDCGGPCKTCPTCEDGIKNQGELRIDCGGPCAPCDDICDMNCNDFFACTLDKCVNGECVSEMIFPCCGNFICENGETIDNCPEDCDLGEEKPVHLMTRSDIIKSAKQKALTDQKDAGYFCDSVPNEEIRDECLRIVAYTSDNKNFCRYINFSVKRDACYMEFAMKYDYSVCDLIENQYLQRTCEALKIRPTPETKKND
jgi:hypothetical protein